MHSSDTETQYTDLRNRSYKLIEMILPRDAICSWIRVSEKASSYKNALAVEATAIIEARIGWAMRSFNSGQAGRRASDNFLRQG